MIDMSFVLGFFLGAALLYFTVAKTLSKRPPRVIEKKELGPHNLEMQITFWGIDTEEARIICENLPVSVVEDEETDNKVVLH